MDKERFTFWHKLASTLVLLALVAGGHTGWKWMAQIRVEAVSVSGAINVTESEVENIMRVAPGSVMYDINPIVLEDRLDRHPWILKSAVSRLPSGILRVEFRERKPVALLVDPRAKSRYYADKKGYRLPLTSSDFYDVPIISVELGPYHPLHPIAHESTLELLKALPGIPKEVDALISEFIWTESGFDLRLTPVGSHASIPVRLGRKKYGKRLQILKVFWDEEVLRHQNKRYELIDLRFDSQIVVKEHRR